MYQPTTLIEIEYVTYKGKVHYDYVMRSSRSQSQYYLFFVYAANISKVINFLHTSVLHDFMYLVFALYAYDFA